MMKRLKIFTSAAFFLCAIFYCGYSTSEEKKPGEEKPKDMTDLIKQYVLDEKASKQAEALTEIMKSDTIKPDEINKWVKCVLDYTAKRPKCGKLPSPVLNSKLYPMKYFVGGKPGKKATALLVYMHGGGNMMDINDLGWDQAKGFLSDLGIPVGIAPRVLDDTSAVGWAEPDSLTAMIEMIKEFKRTYSVDTNQIYIGGYSMGGWGAPIVGAVHADYFAGVFGFGGGTDGNSAKNIMSNFYNLPISINIGQQDEDFGRLETCRMMRDALKELQQENPKAYKYEYKEYPGQGHFVPSPKDHADVGKWMKQSKRDPYPKTIVWRPLGNTKKYFYWLKVPNASLGMSIKAEITKENYIEITGNNLSTFTVFLNSEMVDLAKPVTVAVNKTEKFTGIVNYSLSAIVETLAEKEDKNMYFTARIDIGK